MKTVQIILRNTIIGGLLVSLFTPLVVSNDFFFPFIVGKAFYFRLIIEAIFGLWLMLAVLNPEYRPRRSWLLGAVTVFMIVVGLADAFGFYPTRSFWSNFERMEGYVTLLHLFAYFIVASSILKTRALWQTFFSTSLVVSFILSMYSFFQLAGTFDVHQGGTRVDATLGNSAYLGVYMLLHIFIALMYALQSRVMWQKVLYFLLIPLQIITLYYTATRGSILGFIGGLLLTGLLIALFNKEDKQLRKGAIGALVLVLVVVGGFFALRTTSFVQKSPVLSRFASISTQERTTKSRFIIWNMAWQGVKEHPILGWGQENFNIVFNKYYNPGMYDQEQWFDHAHNVIFDWLINAGFLGLLAYLAMFVITLVYIWRGALSVNEKAVLTGLLAGYFFHNIFVFDNLVSYMIFFAILAYVHVITVNAKDQTTKSLPEANLALQQIALVAIVPLTFFGMYFFNWNAVQANTTLLKAMTVVDTQIPSISSCENIVMQKTESGVSRVCAKSTSTYDLFKKAISYKSLGTAEIREQLLYSFPRVETSKVADAEKTKYFMFGIDEMFAQTRETPVDARYHLILGTYLANFGQLDQALEELNKAITLSPQKQTIIIPTAQVYFSKKDNEKALQLFKTAYDLEPHFELAAKQYVVALTLLGKKAEAMEVLKNHEVINDPDIIGLYYEMKNYTAVIEILTSLMERNPTDIQTRLSLSVAYLRAGQREEAVRVLKKAVEDIPIFKTQGEYLIKEIQAGRNPITVKN